MGFLGGFKRAMRATGRVAKAALPMATMVAGMVNPALGMGLRIASGILDAENQFPEQGSGMEKAQFVRWKIQKSLPGILRTAEAIRGKEFVDEEAITKALDDMLDAQFRLLSLTGLVNKAEAVAK